jgi:hypothetical protein
MGYTSEQIHQRREELADRLGDDDIDKTSVSWRDSRKIDVMKAAIESYDVHQQLSSDLRRMKQIHGRQYIEALQKTYEVVASERTSDLITEIGESGRYKEAYNWVQHLPSGPAALEQRKIALRPPRPDEAVSQQTKSVIQKYTFQQQNELYYETNHAKIRNYLLYGVEHDGNYTAELATDLRKILSEGTLNKASIKELKDIMVERIASKYKAAGRVAQDSRRVDNSNPQEIMLNDLREFYKELKQPDMLRKLVNPQYSLVNTQYKAIYAHDGPLEPLHDIRGRMKRPLEALGSEPDLAILKDDAARKEWAILNSLRQDFDVLTALWEHRSSLVETGHAKAQTLKQQSEADRAAVRAVARAEDDRKYAIDDWVDQEQDSEFNGRITKWAVREYGEYKKAWPSWYKRAKSVVGDKATEFASDQVKDTVWDHVKGHFGGFFNGN